MNQIIKNDSRLSNWENLSNCGQFESPKTRIFNRTITQITQLLNYQINQSYPLMNGVLIIDKPAGLTSHDVVNRARRILHERSIGHLGTLDPMATGVLPLVTGTLTRLAQFYTTSKKPTKAS